MLETPCGGLAGNIIMGIMLINADPEQVDIEKGDEEIEASTGRVKMEIMQKM